jgi:hypothetical protein
MPDPIPGPKLYQQRAMMAFPLLVQLAEAHQTISYSDLAENLEMHPRNLNYPLGCIGATLEKLAQLRNEGIPPIQYLVTNQKTGRPGCLQEHEFAAHIQNIFNYRRWREVLVALLH